MIPPLVLLLFYSVSALASSVLTRRCCLTKSGAFLNEPVDDADLTLLFFVWFVPVINTMWAIAVAIYWLIKTADQWLQSVSQTSIANKIVSAIRYACLGRQRQDIQTQKKNLVGQ